MSAVILPFLRRTRMWLFLPAAAAALLLAAPGVRAQERIERDGIVLFWGVVPAAIASQQHALSELHGGKPAGGGKVNHLVVAVFDAKSGSRIDDAVIRAQLSEPGIAQEPAKYLPPMPINGLGSYGQLFGMVYSGPYRFRIWVKLPGRPDEIELDVTATPQLGGSR